MAEIASEKEQWDFLRSRAGSEGDRHPDWPEDVRSISDTGFLFLGIDDENQLYWDGKPIEINRRLTFSRLQMLAAIVVGVAAVVGGTGTGLNEGLDFGCKVHWWTHWCSR